MAKKLVLLVAITLLAHATCAMAHWDLGDSCKWCQLPDLDTTGVDINATYTQFEPFVLADDFECTETGFIRDIHIWGSWLDDYLPGGEFPGAVTFDLAIHEDIPDSESATGYSMPGNVLWQATFGPGRFTVRKWETGLDEGWMNPANEYWSPADTTCWQYNFYMDDNEAFWQDGTPNTPRVYWLSVQALPNDPQAWFGWKTSLDHWNDDAVWGLGQVPFLGDWYELIYPPVHPMGGQSIDLAFVITSQGRPDGIDYGDAPDDTTMTYPTLLANSGAHHVILGPWLGGSVDTRDAEPDGQPDIFASGDDDNERDDEDGVSIPPLIIGEPCTLKVSVGGGGGVVVGWIDFDRDYDWDSADLIHAGWLDDGTHDIIVIPPAASVTRRSYARFRINSAGALSSIGRAEDGEVEDYRVFLLSEHPGELDYGDAPDTLEEFDGYRTLLAHNGARHVIAGPWLGWDPDNRDVEIDGQPNWTATGDDDDGNDDEDGVSVGVLRRGQTSNVLLQVSGGGGYVRGWIDFDGSGSWELDERVIDGYFADGGYIVFVSTPFDAVVGKTFARFRISTEQGLPSWREAADGEVEDYEVYIEGDVTSKWFQPPDLETTGIDVLVSEPYLLADDFECTESGLITEINIWGSWMYDHLPFGWDQDAVDFTLSFHEDIPDSESSTGYSMPGEVLWYRTFSPGEFRSFVWADSILEGWLKPPSEYGFPVDSTCWVYRFQIDPEDAFYQAGTAGTPVVYWLDVQAAPYDDLADFGWKTSRVHWNDDAVWVQGSEPYSGLWNELRYPWEHPWPGESIDLAFELIGDVTTAVPGGSSEAPQGFDLLQNVPNPFNPVTTIQYSIPGGGGHVRLQIFDVRGRLVRRLVDGWQPGGRHLATWQGRDDRGREVPTGIYFYRLTLEDKSASRKMLLLK